MQNDLMEPRKVDTPPCCPDLIDRCARIACSAAPG